MANRDEQRVDNQPEKEPSPSNGCENITLPGLGLFVDAISKEQKTAQSAADLQVVD